MHDQALVVNPERDRTAEAEHGAATKALCEAQGVKSMGQDFGEDPGVCVCVCVLMPGLPLA